MVNFEMKYPVEGTAALNPCRKNDPVQQGIIIAFPVKGSVTSRVSSLSEDDLFRSGCKESTEISLSSCEISFISELRHDVDLLVRTDFLENLRCGSMRGVSSGRLQRWQVVAATCLFSALAFAALFL